MTRSYLKRIGLRLEDVRPYELEEAEARLRATGGRANYRMAITLLDEGRLFQRGGVTTDAATAEATVDLSGGTPALLCQDGSGDFSVPRNQEANIALPSSGGERTGIVPDAATADEATAEEASAAPIYDASS